MIGRGLRVLLWVLPRKMIGRVLRVLRWILPRNGLGDAIYAWVLHTRAQRRLPGRKDSGRLNDRLFWMKVDGTLLDPLRQFVTDKEYVKQYVTAVVGRQYAMETFQVLRTDEDVDRLELTRFPCVVKPTHSSGQVRVLHGPSDPVDRELLKRWLRVNLYRLSREQNHKHLTPKIIVEEFFSEDRRTVPSDYKVFCFDGVPRFIQVDSDRFVAHTRNLYDTAWKRLPYAYHYPERTQDDPPPQQLEQMLDIASKLSCPFPFIRVDLYTDGTTVKVGELTNCPESSNGRITPSFRRICPWQSHPVGDTTG